MQDQVPGLESPHYACLYAWLSGSFARELSDVQIAELTSPELVAWLAVLEPIPALTTPVVQLCSSGPMPGWNWPPTLPGCS